MTIFTPLPRRSTHISRIKSLARAEIIQLLRNRTLLYMATIPILISLWYSQQDDSSTKTTVTFFETLTLLVIVFCAYYPVLSMATTRREEKVLKRLRTGESTDIDILISLGIGPALGSIVILILGGRILFSTRLSLPENPLPLLLSIVLSVTLAWALALVTSIFTPNAESAQITSLPLVLIIFLSSRSIREFLPDNAAQIMDYTPFAAVSDLIYFSWEANAHYVNSIGILCTWTLVCTLVGIIFMKWENDR